MTMYRSTVALLALLVCAGCSKGKDPIGPSSARQNDEARGYVYGLMTDIPEEEFLALPRRDRERLEYYGSTFEQQSDGSFTWHFPYPDRRLGIVIRGKVEVGPAMDSSFELPTDAASMKMDSLQLLFDGQAVKAPPPVKVIRHPNRSVELQLGFQYAKAGCVMRHNGAKGNGIEGVCGSCTACIDNNGLWSFSGCRTSRWVGFPGSDCNAAWLVFGLCGYPNDNYCINGRNCSPLIRHSRCWHKG